MATVRSLSGQFESQIGQETSRFHMCFTFFHRDSLSAAKVVQKNGLRAANKNQERKLELILAPKAGANKNQERKLQQILATVKNLSRYFGTSNR